MEKFTTHLGKAVALRRSNVDTDQIIPAEFLKRVTRNGFEDALFFAWRQDPDFVLNHPANVNASVLVTGPDFGTGSSREHAVWALTDYGFRVVISSRFADIFRGNAGKGGLVAAQVDQEVVDQIWEYLDTHPGAEMTVDLVDCIITIDDLQAPFMIDDDVRWRLLEGLDDIGISLQHEAAIEEFERSRREFMPTTM
jgi:3-isopropylmalate/(R)-2-methylmalate dehydratase small subunit